MTGALWAVVLAAAPPTEAACDAGDRDACRSAAEAYATGTGVPKDLARAAYLRGRAEWAPRARSECRTRESCLIACEGGDRAACQNAMALFEGKPSDKELARYRAACGPKAPEACTGNAMLLILGPKSKSKEALPFLEQGCEGKDTIACGTLGLFFLSGELVKKKDEARGAQMVAASCAADYWPACATLGQAYENGAGVPADEQRATFHYIAACMGNDARACFTVADIFEKGYANVAKDKARAVNFYREACVRGVKDGCAAVTRLQATDPVDLSTPMDAAASAKLDRTVEPYVAQARKTWPAVRTRFAKGLPKGYPLYVVTRLYDADGKHETLYVLVRAIEPKTNRIVGVINSDVRLLKEHRRGDAVFVDDQDIRDWVIVAPDGSEEGNVVGKFLDTHRP